MQHGRVIRWLRRRYSGSIMHFQYMPDGSDRQTDRQTPARCLPLFTMETANVVTFSAALV